MTDLLSAERDIRARRNAIDYATRALWEAQGDLLAAIEAGNAEDAELWREVVAAESRCLAYARDGYDLAFDRLAALRSAASPLVLVPRAMTPDEARALASANIDLGACRDALAVWEDICDDDLAACAGPDAADARDQMRFDRSVRDALLREVHACLDERAPLLAAQWEAV